MCKITLLLACLVCTGHGRGTYRSLLERRRLWNAGERALRAQSSVGDRSSEQGAVNTLKALQMLLLAFSSAVTSRGSTSQSSSATRDSLLAGKCVFQLIKKEPVQFPVRVRSRAAPIRAGITDDFRLLRDSALPLCGKRILLPSPRTEAAPLMLALIQAAARPIWCPSIKVQPMTDLSDLDDLLMRLVEYDALIVLSPHSVEVLAERFVSLLGGQDTDGMVGTMLEASDVQVGVIGSDSILLQQRLGTSYNIIAPLDQNVRALAKTLVDLEYVKPDARVLVCSGRIGSGGGEGQPKAVASMLRALEASGADVDVIDTHALVMSEPKDIEAELGLLRRGEIDAICAASAEEISALVQLKAASQPDSSDETPKLTIVALGEETAAAAAELVPSAEVIEVGEKCGEQTVVAALEQHFGAGKLLL